MEAISGIKVGFQYRKDSVVLEDIDFLIESGKMTSILGRNGCGKSTLIKLIAALLPITKGSIIFNGFDISTIEGVNHLRKSCGIVFQNPDNQFVSPIIEDDIRFGLDNHHIPESEYKNRIQKALEFVNIAGFEKRNISSLSGGQKQLAAAAGILALDNEILIFDEATSMLDPDGKDDLLKCIDKLRGQGHTIIFITQNIADCVNSDQIILMADHHILDFGTPDKVLSNYENLHLAGVQIPFPVQIYHDLAEKGIFLPFCPLNNTELAEALCALS